VLGVLVVVSLALITIYFREPAGGALHRVQSVGVTVLRPFESSAERVARPFRDLYGWAADLFNAKAENARLRGEIARYKQLYVQNESALQENVTLRALLRFRDSPRFPSGYRAVNARVIAAPPSQFEQRIIVAAGSSNGIREQDPVINARGLVGEVTKVTPDASEVTLLTDEESAVAAMDISGPSGIIRHGHGSGDTLILDYVTKDQVVYRNDLVVTAGTLGNGRLRSLYPKGIPIGIVTSVGQSDADQYKQIQVDPYVDFSSLDAVAVLVSKKPRLKLP
jgi:rod shape-determining protein MreC